MATQTRRKPQETDKPDTEPEADAPETDEKDDAPESDKPVDAPETDNSTNGAEAPTTDEPSIPALPDGWVAEHPLVAEYHESVLAAEAAKGQPTPIADFVAAADKLFGVPTGFEVAEALGTDLEAATETYGAFKGIVDKLRESTEGVDRSEGDNLTEALEALVKVPRGISSETDKAAIPVLAARWRASAPKRTSAGAGSGTPRNGQSDIPSLERRVRYRCGTCGKTFSTGKDNLNSARNECIKHSRTHGLNKSNGTNDFKELGNGFFRAGLTFEGKRANSDELVDSIERGGWVISRDAG